MMWFLRLKELWLIKQKKNNKNVRISNKVSLYLEELASSRLGQADILALEKIRALKNSSYQTPVTEVTFLMFLIKALNCKKILEIGTFKGFTALQFLRATDGRGRVVTLENDKSNVEDAKNLWSKNNVTENNISVLSGEASASLKELVAQGETFDFIYIDANKNMYEEYFEHTLKLAHSGTIIALDNMLWAGLVAEPNTSYSHAKILDRLNKKIYASFENATLVPAWDGLLLVEIK